MFCNRCGEEIPDNSLFCPRCGSKQVPVSHSHQTTTDSKESMILKEMKCPNCKAPLNPTAGEAMVVCQYCGTSISVGSSGWEEVSKHYILDIRMGMKSDALNVAKNHMNGLIFNRHLFEKSELKSTELNYIPFWVVEAGYSAHYKYRVVETQNGPNNTQTQQTYILSGNDSGQLLFPVVAIEDPKYALVPEKNPFMLAQKRLLKQTDMNGTIKLLNGTVSEESARIRGKVGVEQFVMNKLKKSVNGFISAETRIELGDVYLIHIPIWGLLFSYKSKMIFLWIDAHTSKVLGEVKG